MKNSINLASEQKEVTSHVVRKLFLYSIFVFAGAFILTATLLSYNFFLKSQLSSLQSDTDKIKLQITTLSSTEAKVVALKERLNSAEKLINTRTDLGAKTASILNIIPQNLSIESVNAGEKSVTIRVTSNNLFSLNSLIEEGIITLIKNKSYGITKADLSTFKVDTKNGNYSLSFQLFFNPQTQQPVFKIPGRS